MSRKSTETNAIELLVALLVRDQYDIVEKPEWLNCDDFEKYKVNLLGYNAVHLKTITDAFNAQKPEDWKTCVRVHLTGKKQFNHPLLAGKDRKTAKADVYLEKEDGTIVGISVKQSAAATKSNYSVEKMLGELGVECKRIRKQFLCDSGFPKYAKENRDAVNVLFYNRANPYWNALREAIAIKNEFIKNELVNYLYSRDNPFEMWEFDGRDLKPLTATGSLESAFEEFEACYFTTVGSPRQCAKMFYKLTVKDLCITKEYRVEVRWKGNHHTASPQFQIHAL